MKTLLTTLLAILLLTACSGNTATPIPMELVVQHSPGARYLEPVLQTCSQKLDPLPIVVKEFPIHQLDVLAGDLTITLIEPAKPDSPIYQLGSDDLVLITRSPAPVGSVSSTEIAGVFRGFLTNWQVLGASASAAISIIGYKPGNELQDLIEHKIAENGSIPLLATRMEDTTSVLALITAIPNSLAFIPVSQLTDNVTSISILDADSQLLSYPILAQTRVEPSGDLEKLMICIQDDLNRK